MGVIIPPKQALVDRWIVHYAVYKIFWSTPMQGQPCIKYIGASVFWPFYRCVLGLLERWIIRQGPKYQL